jgi:sigma-B regulation protein RsbU (phosphoserine phosphatase)
MFSARVRTFASGAAGPGLIYQGVYSSLPAGAERRCGLLPEEQSRVTDTDVRRPYRENGTGPAQRPEALPGWAEKLRDIQSITDAALSALDPQALLEALVGRVKEALQADTAAVLLLDPPSGQLVATAASGLEEEVRQGVRIPVGRGFAGRIAAEDRPVILSEVDHTTVINPILLDKGIRSLMGAPLRAGGVVIGVLHVGTLTPRAFTSDDSDLLQVAADRAALAVQAVNAQIDRAAAAALQHSLLPSALPAVAGLEMAARYVPGSGHVGGDWYDVFVLPSGEVCAVIGDVAGTGLKAAVIMGRMRSALRAYALQTTDPAEVLDRLDHKMRHFEPQAMATVLYAVFTPSLDQVNISCSGHLPPLIAVPGQPTVPVEVFRDLLIGVPGTAPRRTKTATVPAGGLLCLYTDGLVERRDRPIDDGIARLSTALTATDPETGCVLVMGGMADYISHDDDVALLLLRHTSVTDSDNSASDHGASDHGASDHGASGHGASGQVLAGGDPRIRWSGRHAIVTMPAETDVINAADVAELLSAAAAGSPEVITADLTATLFCDSAGVEVLARASDVAAAGGVEFRLALGGSPVARILQLTGLDEVMPLYRDVPHSLATPPPRPGRAPSR